MSERERMLEWLRARLLRRGLLRFEMSVMVLGAGVAGLAASAGLLALGVNSMAIRYPLAVLAAYAAFLCLLRLWVSRHHEHLDLGVDLIPDIPDISFSPGRMREAVPESFGGGGDFGGGGAARSWEAAHEPLARADAISPLADAGSPAADAASHAADAASAVVDLDDAALLLVPIAIAVGGVVAVVYIVYAAPVLLAEIALDFALVSGLYRRLNKLEPEYWLTTAVKRTWLPVASVATMMSIGGFIVQEIAPHADSIGDLFTR